MLASLSLATVASSRPSLALFFFFAASLSTPFLCAQGTLFRIDPLPTDAAQTAPSNGIGDIDADGFPDFAIGLARANGFDGMLELRSGRTGAVLGRLHGDTGAAGSFGASMAGIGDLDGDGFVTAPMNSSAGAMTGALHLYSGPSPTCRPLGSSTAPSMWTWAVRRSCRSS